MRAWVVARIITVNSSAGVSCRPLRTPGDVIGAIVLARVSMAVFPGRCMVVFSTTGATSTGMCVLIAKKGRELQL